MKQKMVGHESAAMVTYEELEDWAKKADELVKNCSIPDVSVSVACDYRNTDCTNDGTMINGVWRCSNHQDTER